MRHTGDQDERAARRLEQLADELDPATVRADEARLREAVEVARAHGWSWNQTAVALGVSRQADRQRSID